MQVLHGSQETARDFFPKKRVLDQVTKKGKVQIKEAETKHFQQGTVNKRLNKLFSGDFEIIDGEMLHH